MRSADGYESVEDFSLHSRALDSVSNFQGATHILNHNPSGDDGGGDPPVPIPNTEVKPSSADGTWGESPRESRTLPGGSFKTRSMRPGLWFFVSAPMTGLSLVTSSSPWARFADVPPAGPWSVAEGSAFSTGKGPGVKAFLSPSLHGRGKMGNPCWACAQKMVYF